MFSKITTILALALVATASASMDPPRLHSSAGRSSDRSQYRLAETSQSALISAPKVVKKLLAKVAAKKLVKKVVAKKKSAAKKLVKMISVKKVKAVKKLAKKVAPKKVKAVKKLVKMISAKKVPAVKKLVKMISAKKVKAVLKKLPIAKFTRDPVAVRETRKEPKRLTMIKSGLNGRGVNPALRVARKGQFGTKTFLDSRAAFKQAQDARAVFRSKQKVLAAKRNSESEIYFKSLAVYIKAKAVAAKAKKDLKVAKDAHDVATAEVKRLSGIKTTQTKTRNTTRDAHNLAKKTHRLSLAELAKLKATRVAADATVDKTKKKLVKDTAAAADAKTKSANQKKIVDANHLKCDAAKAKWQAAKKTLKATQAKLAAAQKDEAAKKVTHGTTATASKAADDQVVTDTGAWKKSKKAALAAHDKVRAGMVSNKKDW